MLRTTINTSEYSGEKLYKVREKQINAMIIGVHTRAAALSHAHIRMDGRGRQGDDNSGNTIRSV